MYNNIKSAKLTTKSLDKIFQEFIDVLTPFDRRLETAANIKRYFGHMEKWFKVLTDLDAYTADLEPEKNTGIYKIFSDAPDREKPRAILSDLQQTYKANKNLIMAFAFLHDTGKLFYNPSHVVTSTQVYESLLATEFYSVRDTIFHRMVSAELNETERNILKILIAEHAIGSINFDGNYGQVIRLEDEINKLNLDQDGRNNFYKILTVVVNLDRAAVGEVHGEGFMTYFDYHLLNEKMQEVLNSSSVFNKPEDIASFITNQIIMFDPSKAKGYQKFYPYILGELKNNFSAGEISVLCGLLDKATKEVAESFYINGYMFHFANGRKVNFKEDFYQKDPAILASEGVFKRFVFIKLLIALIFSKEASRIQKFNEYSTTPDEARDIFEVTPEEILSILKKCINGEKIDSIFKA